MGDSFFPLIIALLIQALPLLALPALFKASSSVLGRIQNLTQSTIKRAGGDRLNEGYQDRIRTNAAERNANRIDNLRGRQAAGGPGSRRAGFEAWARDGRGRRIAMEKRRGSIDAAAKARFSEEALRNPNGRWGQIADRSHDMEDRASTGSTLEKAHYTGTASQFNADGTAVNDRSQRALDRKLATGQTTAAEGRQQSAYNTQAVQQTTPLGQAASATYLENAALTGENKALDQALDKRAKRQRNAGATPVGARMAAAEAQSKTNDVQISNLDDNFQLAYENDRNTGATPAGRTAATAARGQKQVKQQLEQSTADFDASYDQAIVNVREGSAAPAWAGQAAAVATATSTSKVARDAAAKDVERTYDDLVNVGLQAPLVAAPAAQAAGAARRSLEQSTIGASNAAGRVKSTLTAQGASGADRVLDNLQQEAIEVGKTQKLADEQVQNNYKDDIITDPTSTRAELEKTLADVSKESEGMDAVIKDQYAQDVLNNVNRRGDLERGVIDAKETLTETEGDIKTQLDDERAVGASNPGAATAFGAAAAARAIRMEGQTTDQATSAATVKRRITQEKTTGSLRGNESAKVTAETRLAQGEAALGEAIADEKSDATTSLGQAERDKRLADESKRQAETGTDLVIKGEESEARRINDELRVANEAAGDERAKLVQESAAYQQRGLDASLSDEELAEAAEAMEKTELKIAQIDAIQENKQRDFAPLTPEQLTAAAQAEQKFVQEQQTARLSRREQAANSVRVTSDEAFAREAAGGDSADEADIIRVKAGAISKQVGVESEEASNRVQLLGYGARQSGMQVKKYVKSVLEAASKANFDPTTYVAENGEETPIDDQTLISMAEYAAANGEIPFLEELRASKEGIQDALDDIIRRNSGAIMAKGGFHLASNFKLRAGHPDFDAKAMDTGRLTTLAGSTAEDVGGMKFMQFVNTLGSVADRPEDANGNFTTVLNPEKAKDMLGTISPSEARTIAATLHDVLTVPSARAKAGDRLSYVVQMAEAINSAGIDGVSVEIPPKDIVDFGVASGNTGDGESGDAGDS